MLSIENTMQQNKLFKISHLAKYLFIFTILATVVSYVGAYDKMVWWMEALPVLIGLPILFVTRENFRLTRLIYLFLFIHALILLLGAHYTYAKVPFFDFGDRNNYDKVGHFMQGFVPALLGRELLLRTSPLKAGKWLFAIICLACLGISAIYEIIEWATAMATGEAAEAFLGTQGDVWDTQKDMAWAGIGAAVAQLLLGSLHNRQLKQLLKK